MSGSAPHDIPVGVLTALALPRFDSLDEQRATGRACVWTGEPLTIETAVDLGERIGPRGRWYPRASRRAVAERAHRALFWHAPTCLACGDGTRADCALGAALRHLVAAPAPVRHCRSCERQTAPGEEYETHQSQPPSGAPGVTACAHSGPCRRRPR
ncbi:hypothetical protein ACIQKE_27565 [Streptomyces griseoviridis]|uniref:hypothetical protein n=1 Tax=Streptomyces TaxID=1883 RepID=UPI0024746952|nr:hypothetical protein [Streptomyces sp. MAA16]MDH6700864.1 hypothetical protein [Streptomyces sp. MAA16]